MENLAFDQVFFKKILLERHNMPTDQVDKILQQWLTVRPDLDCSSMGVVGRLRRTSESWKEKLAVVFKAHDLSNIEFDILATIRRSGPEPLLQQNCTKP